MRNRNARHSSAPNPACPWALATSGPRPTTISATGRSLTLFAALNYLEGKLITRIAQRHRHQEWLAFLKIIDRESPPGLDIHLIADNYATHKHAEVKRWLAKHPRFHMTSLPPPRPGSTWSNASFAIL